MSEFSRRNFFAQGAAAGVAASLMGAGAASAAQTGRRARGSVPASAAPAGAARGTGGPQLNDVWGQDFLNQWSPPAEVKRDLTPGRQTIRLSGQQIPRFTGAEGQDYADIFSNMRRQGWSAVETGSANWLARKRPESEIREIKAQLKANDIVFYGIHCAGNIIAPDPDADRWQRHMIDTVHAAEEMGCELILTHSGSLYPSRDRAHPMNWSREAWQRSVNALKRICRETSGSKVKVAIEPVITEAINNPWAMKRMREEVGDPRLTCGLDITNMLSTHNAFRMSEYIDTTFDLLEDQIAYLHAKDIVWNDMLPGLNWAMQGTGLMDYELFLARISRLPIQPYLLVEFLSQDPMYAQAQRNIRDIAGKIGVKIYGTQA